MSKVVARFKVEGVDGLKDRSSRQRAQADVARSARAHPSLPAA
ncbi:leucine zipper domain-containing protein [Mesorhizobium amorphae]